MTKEERKERQKAYRQANKEKYKTLGKNYRKNNKESLDEKARKYRELNKGAIAKYKREYVKKRKLVDPAFKLMYNLRSRHIRVLKGAISTTKGLGCDSKFFRDYISNLWTEGMSWDNYGKGKGKWNVDHILPLDLYYTNPELLPKLIHYSNMQPMWELENLKKGNKVA